MMLFTHLLVGLLVGLGATSLGGGPAVLLAGLVGSLLPDLDMFAAHRRTLHSPVGYGAVGVPVSVLAVAFESGALFAVGTLLVSAWLHSAMDVLGAGLELRPWETDRDRAVYNHALGRWHAPRRLVYDGSPGDLALCLGLATLAVLSGDPTVRWLAVALAVPAAIYACSRRAIARRIPEEYDSLSPFLKTRARSLAGRIRQLATGKQGL